MTSRTATRLIGALAVPALGFGLVACSSEEPAKETTGGNDDNQAATQLSPQEAVAAAYQGLDEDSYKMNSSVTVDGLDFMVMTTEVEGENARAVMDMSMSAILEASGEEIDPSMAALFGDMHTETILVDGTAYFQFSGGMFDAMTEEYGADAWFTMDMNASDLAEIYEQIGSVDLASQTELMLKSLENVEKTGDNTFTGTLSADSEAMKQFSEASGGTAAAMEDIQVTVTLDENGLLESMAMALPETEGMTMEMTSTVVETGGDYDIAAPASDNLHDFDSFLGGSGF